ncbi:adenylate/guanylate cyclase domain-containing protein [Mumia sp. DW29H23]|uniref:adenylate/guanylate cyclase domain-containing protein n=1 Tax=Mumia sp. DW29H23 TaxID=3421241 RepID=UPI003D69C406
MTPSDVVADPWLRGWQQRLVGLLEQLSRLGARPDASRDERLRCGTLIFASVLIALLSFIWVVSLLALGDPRSAAVPAAYQVITVVGLVVLTRTRRFDIFRTTQLLVMLTFPVLLQASLGGVVASGGVVLWAIFVPLAALALLGIRRSAPWLAAFLVELVALALLDPVLSRDASDLAPAFVISLFVLNVTGVTVSAWVMLAYFVDQRARAHRALQAERERSERLLLNVLPQPIAERLKSGTGVIADHYDDVTVLFADLVGFTSHAAAIEPAELVALLDRIFSAFDRLVDEEGLEKIKTIGDAYMVAGGLPVERADHVQAVARTALAMQDQIADIAAGTGQEWLDVRIGIDTGPVVAGVIGRRKFIYDLWGDTVNTASRMESHGVPGEIQVTARVASALGPQFLAQPRGTIEVKGKGPMSTYLLRASSAEASAAPSRRRSRPR